MLRKIFHEIILILSVPFTRFHRFIQFMMRHPVYSYRSLITFNLLCFLRVYNRCIFVSILLFCFIRIVLEFLLVHTFFIITTLGRFPDQMWLFREDHKNCFFLDGRLMRLVLVSLENGWFHNRQKNFILMNDENLPKIHQNIGKNWNQLLQ